MEEKRKAKKLARKFDGMVKGVSVSSRAHFGHSAAYAAHTIISECEKHSLTEAQIRAAL